MEDFNRDGIDSANFSANFTSTNDETEIFASNDSIVSNFSPFYPPQAAWVAATFAIVFIIVGVIGNLGTIWALLENKKLRGNATTWFVLSLCFSDFLFCTINLPLTASRYIHQAWIFDDLLCQIFPFFFYANFGASLLNITLIAINRYVLISHNNLYDRIYSPCNVALMVLFIWIFSFGLLVLPALKLWGSLGLDPVSFSCTILKKDGTSPKKFLFIFGILLPCIAIIFCYTCIFFKVRNSKRTLRSFQIRPTGSERVVVDPRQRNARHQKERRDEIRLTKMMFIIFATYLISFLPLMIFNVIDDEARRFPGVLHIIASILAWSSAVINPFIYAGSNRQYRQAYGDLLSCWKSCGGDASHNAGSRSCSGNKTCVSDATMAAVQFRTNTNY